MIKRIKVDNLWGERSIDWELTKQVSVLSGTNGSGKSTVLRSVFKMFSDGRLPEDYLALFDSLEVKTDDDVIYSSGFPFDPDNVKGNVLSNLCGPDQFSEAEILSFTSDRKFCDLVDGYLKLTRKTIVRESSLLRFELPSGKLLTPPMLSSGERELIKILALGSMATADDVIILDEPENSLHFDWQKTLLDSILESAPGVQVIVSTHSPAIIMSGWIANVYNIDSISSPLADNLQ